ncbi:MAG TPA: hypothetical protein VF691_17220 [Cytophagaceae bacterium]|jgi:hypothetical protein
MKHLLYLFLVISIPAFSQVPNESLQYNPKALLAFVRQNGKILTTRKMYKTMGACEKLKSEVKKFKHNTSTLLIAQLAFGIGGSIFLSSNESTKEYSWIPLLSMVAVSIPIDVFCSRPRLKILIDEYNTDCVQ